MKTRMFLWLAAFAVCLQSVHAINLQKFHFSNSPVFATLEDGILEDGFITTDYKYILVGSYNYVDSPFIVINGDDREQSLINWSHTFNLGGAYKINKKLQVGLSTFFAYQKADNDPTDQTNEPEKKFLMGDSTIDLKWKFYEKNRLAIAFNPRVYVPTGDEEFYTGNDEFGYYIGFVFDKAFRAFQMALNIGFKNNKGALYAPSGFSNSVDHEEQLHFSIGGLYPLIGKWDLTAEFYRDQPLDGDNEQIPSEFNFGARYARSANSAFFAGIGTGSLFEESNATDLRVYAGYKYFPTKKKKPKKIAYEEKKYGRFYKLYNVYFDTNSHAIKPSEKIKLDEMISHIKNDAYVSQIIIEGYTSKVGSIEYNKALSKRRAKSVTDYVTTSGVNASLIKKVSYGNAKADSVVKNNNKDRKVMFRLYRKR